MMKKVILMIVMLLVLSGVAAAQNNTTVEDPLELPEIEGGVGESTNNTTALDNQTPGETTLNDTSENETALNLTNDLEDGNNTLTNETSDEKWDFLTGQSTIVAFFLSAIPILIGIGVVLKLVKKGKKIVKNPAKLLDIDEMTK